MDIGRLYEVITALNELLEAIEKLPADENETAGIRRSFTSARNNLDRLVQHYAQQGSFQDALWITAMEGGAPSEEASLETAMLIKWLAENRGKE